MFWASCIQSKWHVVLESPLPHIPCPFLRKYIHAGVWPFLSLIVSRVKTIPSTKLTSFASSCDGLRILDPSRLGRAKAPDFWFKHIPILSSNVALYEPFVWAHVLPSASKFAMKYLKTRVVLWLHRMWLLSRTLREQVHTMTCIPERWC
jgi:hypothetical protein